MSKDDIDKAVKDAEAFAEADKKRREEIDTKNAADQVVYQTEKSIKDLGDKMTDSEKSDLQSKVDALKAEISANNIEGMKQKREELEKAFFAVSERVYKEAGASAQPAGDAAAAGAQSAPADDGVVDAEYTEVKDDEDKK